MEPEVVEPDLEQLVGRDRRRDPGDDAHDLGEHAASVYHDQGIATNSRNDQLVPLSPSFSSRDGRAQPARPIASPHSMGSVRTTKIAETSEATMPAMRVTAKPFTGPVPN